MNILRAATAIAAMLTLSLAAASAGAAAGFPAGDYEAGTLTLHFSADGKLQVSQGGKVMVEGTYTSDRKTLALRDVSGPQACPPSDKPAGRYAWHIEGNALTLTKIEDTCEDRSQDLTGHPWQRK